MIRYPVFLAVAYFLWIIRVMPHQTLIVVLGMYLLYWLFVKEE